MRPRIDRWRPVMALAVVLVACAVPGMPGGLGLPALRALVAAFGLFILPAHLFALATGFDADAHPAERPALWLVAAFAILLPSLALTALLHAPLGAFLVGHGIVSALLAGVATYRTTRSVPGPTPSGDGRDDGSDRRRLLVIGTCVLVCVTTLLACRFTASGSVDRWWYLGYVRGYLDSPQLTFVEPFLGTGYVHPRFELNVWLLIMAAWSYVAHVDPVWLYDRACPVLLVPAAFSAAFLLGRTLFQSHRLAWITALTSGLLWTSGSLFPIVARIPEDKLLAALILAPVVTAESIRLLDRRTPTRVWTAAMAAAVLATTHALIYAFALVPIVPYALLGARRRVVSQATVSLLVGLLVLGALYPAVSGLRSRVELRNDGATLVHQDHPVVRIHRARGRLLEFRGREWQADTPLNSALRGWFVVSPKLIVHPLTLLALCALVVLPLRPERERRLLWPATLIPLGIAFVPPLAALMGRIVLPWMVYRILWFVPFGLLLAVLTDEGLKRLGRRGWIAFAIVTALAVPGWSEVTLKRIQPDRERLAAPRDAAFRALIDALRHLPPEAVIAAAPELSERIAAFVDRRVLAMSDRATIVFTGSRDLGEARMRARAAVMAGLWRPREGVPEPTHVLYADDSPAARYCGERLLRGDAYRLCTFVPAEPAPGVRMQRAATNADGPQRATLADLLESGDPWLVAECNPLPAEEKPIMQWPRPGPWSARTIELNCRIAAADEGGPARFQPRTVAFVPYLGSAVEEFIVAATGRLNGKQRWNVRTRVRAEHGEQLRFALPRGEVDSIRLRVIPILLPFLKLSSLDLTFEDMPAEPAR